MSPFSIIRALTATCLIISGTCGSAQWESLEGGVDGTAYCFETSSDSARLIVAGMFVWTRQDSLRANTIASWDGNTWSVAEFDHGNGDSLDSGVNPSHTIALFHDTLFLTFGHNTWHGDPAMGYIAYLAGGHWHPCGSPPAGSFFVFKANGRLFCGSVGSTLYGQYMPNIREWTGGAWHTLPNSPFDGNSVAYCADRWHGQYYFGGIFFEGGARNIIAFDGVDQWDTLADGVGGGWIGAIKGFGDSLYVGGYFLPGPNVQSKHIQLWDGNSWKPFFPEVVFDGQVFQMEVYQGALYINGVYHFVGETTEYGILRFDGQHLCAIGGPMPEDHLRIAFFQGDLYCATGYSFAPLYSECIGRLPLDGLVPDECVTVAGIEEHGTNTQAIVFPNPATSEVAISYAGNNARSLEVMDILGRPVLQTTYTRNAPLDVSALALGTYTLRLFDARGVAGAVGRFVKE